MSWRLLAGATAILIGLLLCDEANKSLSASPPTQAASTTPSIEAVRELADLAVLEVEVTDVATASVNGHLGSTTVVMLVRGTATIAVNLEEARFIEVDEQRRHLVLALPIPEVRRVALNPQTSSVLSCERSGLWQIATGDAHEGEAISIAMAHSQDRLTQAASQSNLHDRAQRHSEALLRGFMEELGWTLDVRWGE